MQKTILLIEDNQDIRENTAELLELEGYLVITANNGTEGIRLAALELPDLVICDVLMQETDGYAVFSALLESTTTGHIPFVFMTAKSENADRAKALSIGYCDYLIKPFDENELFASVKKMLSDGGVENTR